jgi:hypothetical protein
MPAISQRNIGTVMIRSDERSVMVDGTDDHDNPKRRQNRSRWKTIGRVFRILIGIVLFGSLLLYGQSKGNAILIQSSLRGRGKNGNANVAHSGNDMPMTTSPTPQSKEDLQWASYTHWEMWEHRNCDKVLEQGRPILEQEAWKNLRSLYTSIVGHENSTIGSLESDHNGFVQPYYVQHNQYGRGIYAAVDIPQGALIWQNIRSAQFSDGASFREFVKRVQPNDLACDVLQWGYVDYLPKINVDLDEGALCNDGGNESNVDFDEGRSSMFPVRPGIQLFANRNISKDEELLCYYGGFSSARWSDFGL